MSKKVIYKENDIEKEIEFEDLEKIEDIEIFEEEEDDEIDKKSVKGKIIAITPFVCLIVYLLLGFYKDLWHPGWIIFLLIPLVPILFKMFSKKKKNIISILSMLITIIYFVLGFWKNLWHPGWIIFLLIPIVSILFGGNND